MAPPNWIEDADYPDGRRMVMTNAEQAECDADTFDELAPIIDDLGDDIVAAWPNPDDAARMRETLQLAAEIFPEAARLLRLGLE